MAIGLVGPYKLKNFNAMHFRHVQIQNHEIYRCKSQTFDGFQTAAGLTELHVSQPFNDEITIRRIVGESSTTNT